MLFSLQKINCTAQREKKIQKFKDKKTRVNLVLKLDLNKDENKFLEIFVFRHIRFFKMGYDVGHNLPYLF